MIKNILLIIASISLIGCNSQSQSEAQGEKLKKQLERGIKYTFYESRCTEKENIKCISQEMYEQLCKANEGMTGWSEISLVVPDRKAHELYDGGTVETAKVYWSDSTKKCIGTITVSGIYRGTSARATNDGTVTEFTLNDKNKIVVSGISARL